MTLKQETYIDQVEITFGGVLQVRCKKAIFRDGVEIGFEYHRTTIPPGADHAEQLSLVNEHLAAMKQAKIDAADWGKRVGALVPVVHTAEVKASYAKG